MSSAHRPTWVAAFGGAGLRDGATSAPTYQHSSKDMPAHTKLKYRQVGQDAPEEVTAVGSGLQPTAEPQQPSENISYDDSDIDVNEEEGSDDLSESESEDDDSEELMRELEKIKREREELKLRERAEKEKEIIKANPLLNLGSNDGFAVKRRWDDDVIFKNQASGINDKPKKRFINDTTRSDFHRKFLDKYVQ